MQEEIEQKTVVMATKAARFTAAELKQIIEKYLAYQKSRKTEKEPEDVIPRGKQTMSELTSGNLAVDSRELSEGNIRTFDRVARKYGVDYAVRKDRTSEPPVYLVFFKAKDRSVLNTAFRDYVEKTGRDTELRASVLEKLSRAKAAVRDLPTKIRHRELER